MKRSPQHYWLEWEGAPIEEYAAKWAALGLDPSISSVGVFYPGDIVEIPGKPFRMVIVRKIDEHERMNRRRLARAVGMPESDFPHCYIIHAD